MVTNFCANRGNLIVILCEAYFSVNKSKKEVIVVIRKEYILNNVKYKETNIKDYFTTSYGDIAKIILEDEVLKSYFLFKTYITKEGYERVELNRKKYFVHRLVYDAWGDKPLDINLVIDHIDANPLNNNISNLRQVTQAINIQNAINHGNFGSNNTTKINVYDSDKGINKQYNSIKEFFIDINAPDYIIKHGALSGLKKRKEYKKYICTKI